MTIGATSPDPCAETPADVRPQSPEQSRPDWKLVLFMAVVSVGSGLAVLAFITQAGKVSRFNDFYREAWPAYAALAHGQLTRFLDLGPAYVGSLVLRAPFALVPTIWGGGPREMFFAAALPCVFAVSGFCVWLAIQPQGRRVGPGSLLAPLVLCIFSPVAIIALGGGHPEELLGGVLCVAAVICAARGRPGSAAVLIMLAVINKPWALAAVPVVLVVMPEIPRRALALLACAAGAVLALAAVADSHGVSAILQIGQIGAIFNPPQLLWFFGRHAWIVQHARVEILVLAIVLSVLWRWRRFPVSPPAAAVPEALLLLALVLFARAAFDPWNNLYYHAPFLFALIAYEATSKRMPVLTTIYTVLLLIVVPLKSIPPMSYDTRAAIYGVVALATLTWLAARIYVPTLSSSSARSHSLPTDRSSAPIAAATLSHIQ